MDDAIIMLADIRHDLLDEYIHALSVEARITLSAAILNIDKAIIQIGRAKAADERVANMAAEIEHANSEEG